MCPLGAQRGAVLSSAADDLMAEYSNACLLRNMRRFTMFVSWMSMAVGVLSLMGWLLGIHLLTSVLPGHISIKVNTAIGLILLGASLWLQREERNLRPWVERMTYGAGGLVAFIGFLSLLENLFSWDLGIDQLLFTESAEQAAGSVRPGLMSPVTAVCFVFLGLALAILDRRSRRGFWPAQFLTIVAQIVSIFAVLDFVLDPAVSHTHIAVQTTVTLLLLPGAIICSRPRRGLGSLLASKGPGGTLARRILPFTMLVPAMLGYLRFRGEQAGLFTPWFGVVLMAVAAIVMLSSVTALTALIIDRADRQRIHSDDAQRLSEERLHLLLDGLKDSAVFLLDPEGKVLSWNKATTAITGYSSEEVKGKDCSWLFTKEDMAQGLPRAELEEALARGRMSQEGIRVRKDGSRFWAHVEIAPLYNGDGELRGFSKMLRDMTEHKQAEQAVRESEERYRSLVVATAQIVWTTDAQGEVAGDMPMWRDFTGQSPEEIQGWGWINSLHPDDRQRAATVWSNAVKQRALYEIEYRMRRQDGEYRHVWVRGVPVFGDEGTIREWVGTCTDITERKRAEEEIRKASLYTRSLLEASLDPLVTISKDGKIMDVNQATELVTGYSRQHLIGSDFSNYFTDPEKARRGYEQVFAAGSVRDYPLAIRHTSGMVADVLYNATVFKNEAGEVEGAFAAARDVTERKRAEQALQAERQKFNNILDVLPPYVVLLTPDYHVAFANREFRQRFGESQGRRCFEFLFGRSEPCEICESYKVLKTGKELEWEWTGPDCRNYEIHDFPFTDVSGSTLILEMGIDVTERKRAERALLESEGAFRTLVELVPQLVWMCQPDGLNIYFNQRWVDYTGLTLEESYGRGWATPFHPDDREPAWGAWNRAVETGGTYRIECRLRAADGSYRWFLTKGVPLRNPAGDIVKWFGTCTDIDDLKRAQQELRDLNEELEQRVQVRTAELVAANRELEAFTYSVSHDLRAPLRHIAGFSKILVEEYGSHLVPAARHYLERIHVGTTRMGVLVDDLLNLARVSRQELHLQVAGLNSIVEEVRDELLPETEGREVEWKIGKLPFVECDPSLLRQVFQNLLTNALKFTRPRSPAVIEVGVEEGSAPPVIFVRDNGVGFSMKYADKLFGVFQRLHRPEDFEGTGVGLATVQRILKKHGGRIWAEAELDRGATLRFTLGQSEEPEPNKEEIEPETIMAGVN